MLVRIQKRVRDGWCSRYTGKWDDERLAISLGTYSLPPSSSSHTHIAPKIHPTPTLILISTLTILPSRSRRDAKGGPCCAQW